MNITHQQRDRLRIVARELADEHADAQGLSYTATAAEKHYRDMIEDRIHEGLCFGASETATPSFADVRAEIEEDLRDAEGERRWEAMTGR